MNATINNQTTATATINGNETAKVHAINMQEEVTTAMKNAWSALPWETRRDNANNKAMRREVEKQAAEAGITEQLELAKNAILSRQPVSVVKFRVAFAWAFANHAWIDIKSRVHAMYQETAGEKVRVHLEFVKKLAHRTNPGAKAQVAEHITLVRAYAEYLKWKNIDKQIAIALGQALPKNQRHNGHGPKQHVGVTEIAKALDNRKTGAKQHAEKQLAAVA